MESANTDIKNEAKAAGVRLWQIAYFFGMNDGNFARKLRFELSDAEKEKIRALIKEIASGEG